MYVCYVCDVCVCVCVSKEELMFEELELELFSHNNRITRKVV